MIRICHAQTIADLEGILKLQRDNSLYSITLEEKKIEGFVMVQHKLEDLEAFAKEAPQVLAKDGDEVCGYALAMPKSLRQSMAMLVPMFEQMDKILIQGKSITTYEFITIGQVCIKKGYRGIQLFDQLYDAYQSEFRSKFDFAITEISTSNVRSMRAHERVGFKTIHTFKDEYEEWNIVCWDWNKVLG